MTTCSAERPDGAGVETAGGAGAKTALGGCAGRGAPAYPVGGGSAVGDGILCA